MARVETTQLQFEVTINGERKVLNTIKEVRAQRRILIKQLETQTLSQDEYNKKVAELAKLNGVLSEHRKQIRGIGKDSDQAVGGFGRIGKAARGLQAAFGWISVVLGALAGIIQLGKETFEQTQVAEESLQRINQLTGSTGEALAEANASALAIANTFEVEVSQAIDSANAAANAYLQTGEELGAKFTSSLDAIGQRLLAMDDKGAEFLEQVTEYAPQAAKAGVEFDRFLNIVATGINRGIQTDKLIASVKEFDLRIKDLSTGQRKVLEQTLGRDFTDTLVAGIESGAITGIEALDLVTGKIDELGENSAAAQKLVSNLFGGDGEDATARYLALLSDISGELDQVVDQNNIYIQRKAELLELEKASNQALTDLSLSLDGAGISFERIGLNIKTGFLTGLRQVVEFIRFFPDFFAAATSSGGAFINTLIAGFEKFLRFSLGPVVKLIEQLTGKTFITLPRIELEDDPFAKVRAKILAEREKLAQQQAQAIAIERQVTESLAQGSADKEVEIEQKKVNRKFEIRAVDATREIEQRSMVLATIQEQEIEAAQVIAAAKADIERENAEALAQLRIEQANRQFETQQGLNQQYERAAFAVAQVSSQRIFTDRINKLEAARDKELSLVGDNEKAKARIEERFAQQKEKAERNRRIREKILAITGVGIDTARAIVKTGAELGYPAAIPFQIQAGIIGAIQAGVIAAQQFARGGLIQSLGAGRIDAAPNVSPTPAGDNVLALVKPGEVILNEQQQQALGGAGTFAAIGVPGFNDGGLVTTPSQEAVETAAPSAQTAALLEQMILFNEGIRETQFVSLIGQREAETISQAQSELATAQARRAL